MRQEAMIFGALDPSAHLREGRNRHRELAGKNLAQKDLTLPKWRIFPGISPLRPPFRKWFLQEVELCQTVAKKISPRSSRPLADSGSMLWPRQVRVRAEVMRPLSPGASCAALELLTP